MVFLVCTVYAIVWFMSRSIDFIRCTNMAFCMIVCWFGRSFVWSFVRWLSVCERANERMSEWMNEWMIRARNCIERSARMAAKQREFLFIWMSMMMMMWWWRWWENQNQYQFDREKKRRRHHSFSFRLACVCVCMAHMDICMLIKHTFLFGKYSYPP